MKPITSLLIIATSLYANEASAFDNPPMEKDAQICYGYAMVGYDSVINARLGVPAEYALGMAAQNPAEETTNEQYSINVLKLALNAYLWPGNPHDYAVQVFYNCAKAQGNFLNADLG